MAEIYNYTDFRASSLKEELRRRQQYYADQINLINERYGKIEHELLLDTEATEQALNKQDAHYKQLHQESYKRV